MDLILSYQQPTTLFSRVIHSTGYLVYQFSSTIRAIPDSWSRGQSYLSALVKVTLSDISRSMTWITDRYENSLFYLKTTRTLTKNIDVSNFWVLTTPPFPPYNPPYLPKLNFQLYLVFNSVTCQTSLSPRSECGERGLLVARRQSERKRREGCPVFVPLTAIDHLSYYYYSILLSNNLVIATFFLFSFFFLKPELREPLSLREFKTKNQKPNLSILLSTHCFAEPCVMPKTLEPICTFTK